MLKEAMAKAGLEEFGGFHIETVGEELARSIDPYSFIYKLTPKN
jgi:hypothetical protein